MSLYKAANILGHTNISTTIKLTTSKLVSNVSDIDWLNSTPLRYSDMDLSFPIPVIGKVAIDPKLSVDIYFECG
jgi:hypothetical protein